MVFLEPEENYSLLQIDNNELTRDACGTANEAYFGMDSDSISVTLDGEEINFEGQKPIMENDRVLIPVRGLFEKLGLKGGKKTKTGYSTAADVLESLKRDNPIVASVLYYRQLAKLKSTYADGLLSVIDKKTGRIYSTFNQTITATGRISSTEPNLQNIPVRLELGRELRKVFIPKDGCEFVDADYSQIELRVLASMAEDETLINAFKEGQDIHRLTASQVFNVPFDEVTPKQRSEAKTVNFGMIYGMGASSLSKDLGITRKRAEEYMAGYFAKYPNIKVYMNRTITEASENGYVSTIYGRRRPVPVEGSEHILDIDTAVIAIGQTPNPLIKQTTDGLDTNKWGCIVADEYGSTSKAMVYAGGDVVTGAATVILAMGAGKTAAATIDKALKNK